MRQTESYLGYIKTRQEMLEEIEREWERPKVFDRQIEAAKEVEGERFKILDAYRKGEIRVLVTTDVAARGIDIPAVKYVVNYDLPEDAENYVHRCGRCGRGRNKGQAISFCSKDEEPLLQTIEEYTGENIARLELDPNEYGQILFDADDPNYDWQKLIDQDNDFWDKEDNW